MELDQQASKRARIMLPHESEPIQWTSQQFEILKDDPVLGEDRVYPASAGAGKTCILIERLIRVLSPPISANPAHCLVMAFNTSAAAEIADRLKARLGRQSLISPSQVELILASPTVASTIHGFSRWAAVKYKLVEKDTLHRYSVDELPVILRNALIDNPNLLNDFNWIFVDEYQDCCAIQDSIIQSLRKPHTMVTVIGDVNQNLYTFRGTHPKFLEQFATRDPNRITKSFELTVNLRCSIPIVALAQAIVEKNYCGNGQSTAPRLKSYQSLESYKGPVETSKPELWLMGGHPSARWVIGQVDQDLRQHKLKPQQVAVLCRSNHLLHIVESGLRRRGILTFFARADEDGYGKRDHEKARNRVFLGSIHQAKGMEWHKVYGIGYNQDYFPDHRAVDLKDERNLNFVLNTRAKSQCVLCMDPDSPSILLLEVPLHLFDVKSPTHNQYRLCDGVWPKDWLDDANGDMVARRINVGNRTPKSWYVGVSELLKDMKGETYHRLRQLELLPSSFWDHLQSVPANHDCLTKEPITAEAPALMATWCEDDAVQVYHPWIRDEMLESEFGYFIDTLGRRIVWQMNREKFVNHPDVEYWRDKHADKVLSLTPFRLNITDDMFNKIKYAYDRCRNKNLSWRDLLLELWILSWCASLAKGRSTIVFIAVSNTQLRLYQDLYDKMALNLRHIVDRQTKPCQTAYTVRWRMDTEAAKTLIQPLFTQTGESLAIPTLVGEMDLLADNFILDFKNFMVNANYLPIQHLLQLLLYVHMFHYGYSGEAFGTGHGPQGYNNNNNNTSTSGTIHRVCVNNILADRFYTVPMNEWTRDKSTALVNFLILNHYETFAKQHI